MELFLHDDLKFGVVDFCETFEGEYPFPGEFITMIRFPYCNLSCPWCDTDFSKPNTTITIGEIISSVSRTKRLMITGGEPGIHATKIYNIISKILDTDTYVDKIFVQTNGLIFRSSIDRKLKDDFRFKNFYYVWSPKFYDANSTNQSMNWLLVLKDYVDLDSVYIKLVYDPTTESELIRFVNKVRDLYGYYLLSKCSVMPLTSEDNRLGNYVETFEFCKKNDLNFSPRIHLVYDLK